MQVLCGRIVRHKRNGNIGSGQTDKLVNAESTDQDEITKSWFYLGSANLSPSAW
jgi:hypothetical protein